METLNLLPNCQTVDIVIPFTGESPWLAHACQSVLSQTYDDWRVLLVDDGASDQAICVARDFLSLDNRFLLLRQPLLKSFLSPCYARNYAIVHSNSPLIAFLDSDDIWHPLKLELQVAEYFKSSCLEPVVVSSYYRFYSSSMTVFQRRNPPSAYSRNSLLVGNFIPLSSVLLPRAFFDKYGLFKAVFHEDYDLWLRAFLSSPPPSYSCVPIPLMAYRVHSKNLTSSKRLCFNAVVHLFEAHIGNPWVRNFYILRWIIARFLERLHFPMSMPLPRDFRY